MINDRGSSPINHKLINIFLNSVKTSFSRLMMLIRATDVRMKIETRFAHFDVLIFTDLFEANKNAKLKNTRSFF